MRSWQIRNLLTTIALAVCCGVATAGPESASSEPPNASEVPKQSAKASASETKSETKKSTTAAGTKKSARGGKASAPTKPKSTAQAKTKKAAAPAKNQNAAAPAATTKTAPLPAAKARSAPHRVTGGGVGVLPRVEAPPSTAQDVRLQGIKDRARWAPAKPCAQTNKKVQSTIRAIDKEASKSGDRLVMARIAAEFRVPAETVLAERARLSAPWGELVVAHTLLANTRGVTMDQLFDMRAEGLGWGQIAYGLGLNQKEVVKAVQAEGGVARGKSKPDGTPAAIAGVEPRAAVDETAHAGSSTPDAGAVRGETSAPESVKE